MPETATDVQGVFSSIAKKYDRLNTILTLNIDQLWRKRAVKLCGLQEKDQVLDLCCGTGKMIERLCPAVGETTPVTGLDFNQPMLDVGADRLSRLIPRFRYTLIQGDATALPFEAETFDCVTMAFGIRNIPDKPRALSEMIRVLKPGGRAVCLELSKPEMPVFRNVYDLYFGHVLPVIGYVGTRDKAAYRYLRDSVNGFMTKGQLRSAFEGAGFEKAGFESLTLGVASIHYGTKPASVPDVNPDRNMV